MEIGIGIILLEREILVPEGKPEKIRPKDLKDFFKRARVGDLVQCYETRIYFDPKWFVYEGILEENNNLSYSWIGFIKQDKVPDSIMDIMSYRDMLGRFTVEESGVVFSSYICDNEKLYTPNDAGWKVRYELLKRAGQWKGNLIDLV